MKKFIFFMRHSEAENYAESDFKRKLTEYGKRKAFLKTKNFKDYLLNNSILLDYVFLSDSVRTEMTFDVVSEVFQEELFYTLTDLLYMGGFKELKEIFSIYSDELKEKNSVLIIGHNFGISDMVSILSGKKIYMDTADIKGVAIEVKDSWDNLLEYEGSWDLIYG